MLRCQKLGLGLIGGNRGKDIDGRSVYPLRLPLRINTPKPHTFTPADVSGQILWLDASVSSSVQKSGANVTKWVDRSPAKTDATFVGNSTYSGGNSIVTSPSYNSYFYTATDLRKSINPNVSVFVVYSWLGIGATASQGQVLFGCDAPNGANRCQVLSFPAFTNIQFAYIGGVSTSFQTIPSVNTSAKMLYNVNASTGTTNGSTIYTYGGLVDTFTETSGNESPGNATLYFATGEADQNQFNGYISFNEIIIYNNVVSSTNRGKINSYLSAKWGV